MAMSRWYLVALLVTVIQCVASQNSSPCPKVFEYEPTGSENDRWYGVVQLQTVEELNGVWVHVVLDQPAEALGVRKHFFSLSCIIFSGVTIQPHVCAKLNRDPNWGTKASDFF